MHAVTELQEALAQGCLLHGSPYLVEELEPRQAHDEAKIGGNKEGVYATSNPAIAIWKAVIHPQGKTNLVGWTWDEDEGGKKILHGENVEVGDGYIYVVPATSFEAVAGDSSDHVSTEKVTPSRRVLVTPEDLYDLQKEMGFVIDVC